jgi:GrpB-like predicted nucleotidyltransferase (UPF0157 family)
VPGLGGKPIIDVMLGAAELAIVELRVDELAADGYRYVPEFEKSVPERRYFTKMDGQPGNFHVHAVVLDSPFWKRHLAFRDALRADPELAARYWKIKQQLAKRHPNDRGAYTDAKSTFIREVEQRFLPQVDARLHQIAEFKQTYTEPVRARFYAVHHPELHHHVQYPVRGRGVQAR